MKTTLLKQCRDALAVIKGETSPDGRLTLLPRQSAFIRGVIANLDAELARAGGPSELQIELALMAHVGSDKYHYHTSAQRNHVIAIITAAGVHAPRVTVLEHQWGMANRDQEWLDAIRTAGCIPVTKDGEEIK